MRVRVDHSPRPVLKIWTKIGKYYRADPKALLQIRVKVGFSEDEIKTRMRRGYYAFEKALRGIELDIYEVLSVEYGVGAVFYHHEDQSCGKQTM